MIYQVHTLLFFIALFPLYTRAFQSFFSKPSYSRSTTRLLALSPSDETYLQQAIALAQRGQGHTFPNPAVGCVIVRDGTVIGAGFHPRAGYPHAEIFALLEAAGHVPDGVKAASAVIEPSIDTYDDIQKLFKQYASAEGPSQLFENLFNEQAVTAYVTLEPCCHYGRTPPCALSLAIAGTRRVVVGFPDPNPRVDGGGVRVLRQAGVQVDLADGTTRDACAELVTNFVRRITPRQQRPMNGAMRRALRALSNRRKTEQTLAAVEWNGPRVAELDSIELSPEWMEQLDALLWKEELVLLRLNSAVEKKKAAKSLGELIAMQLGAHLAQTLGHTALLYREGIPPVLDLDELAKGEKNDEEQE